MESGTPGPPPPAPEAPVPPATGALAQADQVPQVKPGSGPPSAAYVAVTEFDWQEEYSRFMPLVKWLLVIPHVFVLVFVLIAAIFAWIGSFFAVLVTGRYPRGIFDFLVGVYDVRNRRKAVRSLAADLELTEKADWEEFPAVNTGSRYLNGQVVVDQYEGVFPDGRVVTLVDVHAYDPGTDEWSNTIHAGGSAPDWEPYRGRFTDGAGEFFQLIETPDGEPLHAAYLGPDHR